MRDIERDIEQTEERQVHQPGGAYSRRSTFVQVKSQADESTAWAWVTLALVVVAGLIAILIFNTSQSINQAPLPTNEKTTERTIVVPGPTQTTVVPGPTQTVEHNTVIHESGTPATPSTAPPESTPDGQPESTPGGP